MLSKLTEQPKALSDVSTNPNQKNTQEVLDEEDQEGHLDPEYNENKCIICLDDFDEITPM